MSHATMRKKDLNHESCWILDSDSPKEPLESSTKNRLRLDSDPSSFKTDQWHQGFINLRVSRSIDRLARLGSFSHLRG